MRCSTLLPALLILASVASNAMAAPELAAMFADLSLPQALARAAKEKRVVLIDFYTTWCGPCRMLDKTTWNDASVRSWAAQHVIAIKVDAEQQEALARQHRIDAYPTILLLRPDGSEIDRLVGYRDPARFLADATAALAGKDSVARARDNLRGAAGKDPMKRMSYAEALAEKGDDATALTEFLWCFDHGLEHDPAFAGVRLSYLLGDIVALGRGYPAAREALQQRRHSLQQRLRAGSAEASGAVDYSALCEQLHEQTDLIATYEELRGRPHTRALRDAMFSQVFPILLQRREYVEIAQEADLLSHIDDDINFYRETQDHMPDDPGLRDYMHRSTLAKLASWYEVAVGVPHAPHAAACVGRILDFERSAAMYELLIQHAVRAGALPAARELVKRALKELPADQRAAIRQVESQIPSKPSR